jgi:photosystem II stability/assembly factor-like uncharacterized protein
MGGWKLAGPFGGSARAIAVDPQNGRTLIAGSRDSLLFRSDDAGASWRLLPFPRGTPGVFNSVLIDPKESPHYYAGLDAGDSQDSGVYESKDGGETWQAATGIRGSRIESLALSPINSSTLAAGTSKGVFVSVDRGATWRRISAANDPEMQDITALAFDPTDTNVLYAGTPHLPWKTTDGGATWYSISSGLVDDSDIFSIRVDPDHPQLVFASACSGIYRSDSGGQAWVKIHGIPGTHRRTHIIAEDPRNSDTIFAGTTLGLFKSPDGGKTWRHLSSEQVNWMVFDPGDPRTLYLATEFAGILKSADSGETFHAMNEGFSNHRLSEITSDGKRLYASSTYEGLYGGVFVSSDGGLQWSLRANEEALQGRNLHSLTASLARADEVFAASEDAILKSADAGKTWVSLPEPRLVVARTSRTGRAGQAIHTAERVHIHALRAVRLEKDKLVLFAGTDAGLFRSSNSGTTWEQVSAAGITGVSVLAIYAPPNGASRLAVRTSSGLFVSEDSGRTWQPSLVPNGYYIYDVALPVEHDIAILAATSRGILQSADEGAHWRLVTEGVPAATVDSVRFNPSEGREAFLVQYGSVYRTVDGGNSWQTFSNEGLQGAAIRMLWFAPDLPLRIFALSAARGALVFDLPQATVAQQDDHAVIASSK